VSRYAARTSSGSRSITRSIEKGGLGASRAACRSAAAAASDGCSRALGVHAGRARHGWRRHPATCTLALIVLARVAGNPNRTSRRPEQALCKVRPRTRLELRLRGAAVLQRPRELLHADAHLGSVLP